jgi:uncharacterized lipoprotein YmbA
MRHNRWLLYLALAALLSACGSTPRSNYYMLSADIAASETASKKNGGPSLGIGPVTVPEYLKRREMVLNLSSNRLELADFDRWAEPLDAGILRVTALNLSKLLDTQQVQVFPWRRSFQPQFGVSIAVVHFGMHGTSAELVAEWTVSDPKAGAAVVQRISRLHTQAEDATPESVAAAYSDLLAKLAREIATAIQP